MLCIKITNPLLFHYVKHNNEWDSWDLRPTDVLKEWVRNSGVQCKIFEMDEMVEFDKNCHCMDSFLFVEFTCQRDLMLFKLTWM